MKNEFLIISIMVIFHLQLFSQNENGNEKYRILTYGMAQSISNIELTVNQKWNIEKISVAGCRVTSKLRDSVKIQNERTWNRIEKEQRIEKPKLEYQKQLNNIRRDLNTIKTIVHNSNVANSIWPNLKRKEKGFLIYENLELLSKLKYVVTVKKRKRKIDGKPQNKIYNLIVDLLSESIFLEE